MTDNTLTDWISSLSTFGAMVIAGVTAYLAYKQYLEPPSQEADPDSATDEAASDYRVCLVVFDTAKQKTQLKIKDKCLECWLLDKRIDKSKLQWTLANSEIERVLAEDDFVVIAGYKVRSGLFSLGRRRNWLYSKKLFPEPAYLHGELHELLKLAVSA